MSDRFEDERGVIIDLFGDGTDNGPVDSVTYISTNRGAIRGNHVHQETTQWTLVLSGRLVMASGDRRSAKRTDVHGGEIVRHDPCVPHAWKALEDTTCLVFTRGPRSGDRYESDTFRLDEPLLT